MARTDKDAPYAVRMVTGEPLRKYREGRRGRKPRASDWSLDPRVYNVR